MIHLGKGRRRGAAATFVAGVTALAVTFVGAGTGSAGAAPNPDNKGVGTVANKLVQIKPAAVEGTFTDPDSGATGEVVGKFAPKEFVEQDGQLAVTGILKGKLTGDVPADTAKQFKESVTFVVTGGGSPDAATPASFQTAAFAPASSHGCDILNLDLGPLDLNLLGLQIDLAPVVLDIVAQPGAGALLGNLLCAVAGLLDGVGGGGLGGLLDGLLDGVIDALNGLLGGLLDLQAITGLIEQIQSVLDGLLGTASTTRTV